jgi:hypothetical protein
MSAAQPFRHLRRPSRDPRGRVLRLLAAVTGAGLVAVGYVLVTQVAGGHRDSVAAQQAATEKIPPLVSAAGLAQRNGIRISQLAVTGAGGLIDLRYQVLDPDKAASVHTGLPELVDERTGVVVNQLLMGHSHKGVLHAGQTYYLLFENPGDLVRRGSEVTVALGGLRVPHIRVR